MEYKPQVSALGWDDILPDAYVRKPSMTVRNSILRQAQEGASEDQAMLEIICACIVRKNLDPFMSKESWDNWLGDHDAKAAELINVVMDLAGFTGDAPKKD